MNSSTMPNEITSCYVLYGPFNLRTKLFYTLFCLIYAIFCVSDPDGMFFTTKHYLTINLASFFFNKPKSKYSDIYWRIACITYSHTTNYFTKYYFLLLLFIKVDRKYVTCMCNLFVLNCSFKMHRCGNRRIVFWGEITKNERNK